MDNLTIQIWYFIENSFDVNDKEKLEMLSYHSREKERIISESGAMGQILFTVLYTVSPFPAMRALGGAFWLLVSLQGKKIKDLRIFWQCLPLIWSRPLENIPFKDAVFCLTMKTLWFGFRNGQLHSTHTNRWRCLGKPQISLNSVSSTWEMWWRWSSFPKQFCQQQPVIVNVILNKIDLPMCWGVLRYYFPY